jgi:hypothetical protein
VPGIDVQASNGADTSINWKAEEGRIRRPEEHCVGVRLLRNVRLSVWRDR